MQAVAVVTSPDAPGHFSLSEFSSCMWSLMILMKLSDRAMPRVLIVHVSDQVAAAFGVGRTCVIRHNRTSEVEPPRYYEVWLVGTPDISNYVMALLAILEDHFVLDISSQDRQRALESAVWAVTADNCLHDIVQ
jgi:hypothetical protein